MNSSPEACRKFNVYQNAAVASVLAARSVRPSAFSFLFIVFLVFVVSLSLAVVVYREEALLNMAAETGLTPSFACYIVRVLQVALAIIFLAAISALCKALSLQYLSDDQVHALSPLPLKDMSDSNVPVSALTERQQVLVGVSNVKQRRQSAEKEHTLDGVTGAKQRTPHSRTATSPSVSSQPNLLVPVHQSVPSMSGRGSGVACTAAASSSIGLQVSPFQSSSYVSPQSATPPRNGISVSPWPKQPSSHIADIADEEKLEEFLADVEDKLVESTVKIQPTSQSLLTPSPTIRGVNVTPPLAGLTPSGTPRSTPVRSLVISPSPQRYSGSPRKGESDLPPPMHMEQVTEAFQKLGVLSHIESWRDQMRQWFSNDLLNPLVVKIDSSHVQVMQAAAKFGLQLSVSPVGGNNSDTAGVPSSPEVVQTHEWITTFAPDEDALLHQLRVFLVQARDAPPPHQPSVFGLQPPPQVRPFNPAIHECLNAVSEHQRLKALLKGEWAKGLLPQSSVRADYTVKRIRELAEGTCVKKYEYLATGELYDKISKKWTLELPTDSHLLIYLFCALLEHPNWMLHIDAASQPSTQSANNPLFIATLPHKERCPEKYVAVLSSAPGFLHAGACILVVGKQNPPIFALYWEKKLQFSLQGRTALWDAVLLLCHRIKLAHGGVVQGINLGSGFNLLPIFETGDPEDADELPFL